jgi:hypothetical protein
MAIVDELHVVTDHTFEALAAVMAVHRAAELAGDASPASTSRRTAALGGARTDRLWARPNRYSGPGTMSQRPPPKAAASRVPRSLPTEPRWAVTAASGPPGLRSPRGPHPDRAGLWGNPVYGADGLPGKAQGRTPPGPPTY